MIPVKWNKAAISQLMSAIHFIEENSYLAYAIEVESEILSKIRNLPQTPTIYPPDVYRRNNDGTYRAFEVYHYRISYRIGKHEIRIVRIRHTSRKPRKY